jgi:hypothetical protein
MKIIITESQYNKILREEEEQKVLHIPSMKIFGGDWDLLQKFLELKGNPPYSIGGGYLSLIGTEIESLGNLQSVEGDLYLSYTPIKSLGNLTSVGGFLDLQNTPLSKKYTKKDIRQMIDVGGKIYL